MSTITVTATCEGCGANAPRPGSTEAASWRFGWDPDDGFLICPACAEHPEKTRTRIKAERDRLGAAFDPSLPQMEFVGVLREVREATRSRQRRTEWVAAGQDNHRDNPSS